MKGKFMGIEWLQINNDRAFKKIVGCKKNTDLRI
jgi:hypothetical protein